MAAKNYRSAQLVFGWSFYRQGTSGAPRPPMNSLMLLLLGLVTQIQESELRGRRAKDWQSSSRIAEPYWSWMGWSHFKIRLVHKKDEYAILQSRRFCARSRRLIRGFA